MAMESLDMASCSSGRCNDTGSGRQRGDRNRFSCFGSSLSLRHGLVIVVVVILSLPCVLGDRLEEDNEIFTVKEKEVKKETGFVKSGATNDVNATAQDLEETIRDSVKTEIELEQNISAFLDVLKDIPEPDVRQKLTEEILAIEKPQAEHIEAKEEVPPIPPAVESGSDQIAASDEHLTINQTSASQESANGGVREARNLNLEFEQESNSLEEIEKILDSREHSPSAHLMHENWAKGDPAQPLELILNENSLPDGHENIGDNDDSDDAIGISPAAVNVPRATTPKPDHFSITLEESLTATEPQLVHNQQLQELMKIELGVEGSGDDEVTVPPGLETSSHSVIKKPGVALFEENDIGDDEVEEIDTEATVRTPIELLKLAESMAASSVHEIVAGEASATAGERQPRTQQVGVTEISFATQAEETTEAAIEGEQSEDEGNGEAAAGNASGKAGEEVSEEEEGVEVEIIKENLSGGEGGGPEVAGEAQTSANDGDKHAAARARAGAEVEEEAEAETKDAAMQDEHYRGEEEAVAGGHVGQTEAEGRSATDAVAEAEVATEPLQESQDVGAAAREEEQEEEVEKKSNNIAHASEEQGSGEGAEEEEDSVEEKAAAAAKTDEPSAIGVGDEEVRIETTTPFEGAESTWSPPTKGSRSVAQKEDGKATLLESYRPHDAGQTLHDHVAESSAGIGKALPTRSVSEGNAVQRSTIVIALCAGIALLFIVISMAIFLVSFQRQHGTLDIEMQEQRCGKDNLNDDDDDEATSMKLLDIELPTVSNAEEIGEEANETDECL